MIKPSENHVLIKPDPLPEFELKNGIIITNPRTKTRTGEIVDVADNVDFLKKGDNVTFLTIHAPEEDGYFLVRVNEEDCRVLYVNH